MIKLKDLILEAGQAAGSLELISTSLAKAKAFATKQFSKFGRNFDDELPNFDDNYKLVQKSANTGKTKRKDMPVIEDEDVKLLQTRLSKGYIDISAPYAKNTNPSNPFPKGLSGKQAERWLKNGLKQHDKADSDSDDIVNVKRGNIIIKKLKPIQKQIYFDISITATAEFGGAKGSATFIKKNTFIISADNYIIDGHHRYLSAMLIDPNMTVPVLSIDLPLSKLLPLTLSYGDAIGNKRNA